METRHNKKLPNESEAYRSSRNALLDEEIKLRSQIEKVAKLRRGLPLGGKVNEDYTFTGTTGEVKLSQLFDVHDSLILYSFMYGPEAENPCPMCTSIIDALNSNAEAIGQNASIAIVAKSNLDRTLAFAKKRNWHDVIILSSENNSYNVDYYGEDENGNQWPICNVFVRRGEDIFHSYATELLHVATEEGSDARHVDLMWPLYNYLDLTPEGRRGWYPRLEYK